MDLRGYNAPRGTQLNRGEAAPSDKDWKSHAISIPAIMLLGFVMYGSKIRSNKIETAANKSARHSEKQYSFLQQSNFNRHINDDSFHAGFLFDILFNFIAQNHHIL